MPDEAPFPGDSDDYDAIEAAVVETERGRWFLKEYARRNRNADSLLILEALDHLNRLMKDRAVKARESRSGDDTVGRPGIAGAGLVLRDAAAGLHHAIGRIEHRRDAWQVLAQERVLTRENGSPNGADGTALRAAGTEALGAIDDILQTLRRLETRITTMMAAGEQPAGDIRAAEIARLKDEMMRDAMPSVPYLM
jgi:hypothetical protein